MKEQANDSYSPLNLTFSIIKDWQNKQFSCVACGTTRSVKYLKNDKPYCNACVLGN